MHKLLARQLRRFYPENTPATSEFAAFVAAVDAAYAENDADRGLLERSIELASTELLERNARLEREVDSIKRLELELRQAEKLRAVGQLAAGIAHEINTPIQYVGNNVNFASEAQRDLLRVAACARECVNGDGSSDLLERLRVALEDADLDYLSSELPRALEHAADGVARVTAIVSAMKDFGRPDLRERVATDLNRCIENTLLVAQAELKYVADVVLRLGELPPVPCYPGELGQVILILLVNAAHAVAARYDGKRRGHVEVVSRCEAGSVVISVTDDGTGIRPEHRARLFEPFFTTKAVGKGTGQGLAIARSIVVEKHGGSLDFESELGVGTTFRLRLPLNPPRSTSVPAPELSP